LFEAPLAVVVNEPELWLTRRMLDGPPEVAPRSKRKMLDWPPPDWPGTRFEAALTNAT
jgi:hypothetical protein